MEHLGRRRSEQHSILHLVCDIGNRFCGWFFTWDLVTQMKPKKKEFREPETWGAVLYKDQWGTYSIDPGGQFDVVPARTIREKDYQRLLKAARRKVR
jgi:hypothetical protein